LFGANAAFIIHHAGGRGYYYDYDYYYYYYYAIRPPTNAVRAGPANLHSMLSGFSV
jgi:hypothetical protein